MRSIEKKIIGASILLLIIVAIGAIVINTYRKNGSTILFKNEKVNNTAKSDKVKASNEDAAANKTTENKPVVQATPAARDFSGMSLKDGTEGVPVLYYHSIESEKGNPLRMPKEKFREQMQYLKDNDYTTLTLDELYDYLANNKPVPKKSVVITLDDGYEDNYTNAYPIIKEFGFKATVFVITSSIDKNPTTLTSAQIKEMNKNGMDIESHTVNHVKLGELSYDQQLKELKDSKDALEKLLDKKVNYVAYPFGSLNNNSAKAAKDAGYTMAFTTAGRWSDKADGILTLDRVYMSSDFSNSVFIDRISNPNYKQ
ncbi:MAG: polysaccharide deacetylase family protein [Bacillota bacterium]|nr:polysaccharide deacetylase family protein [Bacillota bacterium]